MDYSSYPPKIRAIVGRLSKEIEKLIVSVSTGNMSVSQWKREAEHAIVSHMTSAFMVGRGKYSLTEDETASIAKLVQSQQSYLNGFAADMETTDWGDEFPKRWISRAISYATSVVAPFYTGMYWGIPLPAIPGDGTTQCGQSDKCTWEIVKLPGDRNYNATWTLHPAEHCQTCVERARLWRNLEIRNGQLLIPDAMLSKEIGAIVRRYYGD